MNTQQMSWLERHISLPVYKDPISEKENAISHGIASLLSYAFFIFVIIQKNNFPTLSTFVGMVVFSLSQSILFTSSTLYHSFKEGDAKRLFRILDHSTIYFLIVGTYTPIMLFINTRATHYILIFLYIVLVAGIVINILNWGKYKILHVLMYLLMGWSIVFVWNQVIPALPVIYSILLLGQGFSIL